MRKALLCFGALFLFGMANAQTPVYEDDFDSYNAGEGIAAQSDNWFTWNNSDITSDAAVSTAYANGGANSVEVSFAAGSDVVVPVGPFTSGKYDIIFDMYIPQNEEAYFNTMHSWDYTTTTNYEWAIDVFFSNGNITWTAGGVDGGGESYTAGEWFQVQVTADLDNDLGFLYFNGDQAVSWQWSLNNADGTAGLNQLQAVNFFGWGPSQNTGLYYIDNMSVVESTTVSALDLTVTELDGTTYTLSDITDQGKYLFLHFMADWNVFDELMVPEMNQMFENYGCNQGDVYMVGMNNSNNGNTSSQQFIDDYGYMLPMVSIPGNSEDVRLAFGVNAFPTLMLVGPNEEILAMDLYAGAGQTYPVIAQAFADNQIAVMPCSADGGCTDPEASNYDPAALDDDGSCEYDAEYLDLTVTELDGTTYTLSDITDQGKYLFLHFMADWNVFDELMVPEMNQMFENYGCNQGDVYMVGMNNSNNGNTSSQQFIDDYGYMLPMVSIPGNSEDVRLAFGVNAFPTLTLVGPNEEILATDLYAGAGLTYPVIAQAFADNQIAVMPCSADGGCTDDQACNYDPEALEDDGSCEYSCLGCTDSNAGNYDPAATIDDGSCIYFTCDQIGQIDWSLQPIGVSPALLTLDYGVEANEEAILNITSTYFDPEFGNQYEVISFTANQIVGVPEILAISLESMEIPAGGQTCISITGLAAESGEFLVSVSGDLTISLFDNPVVIPANFFFTLSINPPNGDIPGCTYSGADNYNIVATIDDGSCQFSGCTVADAINYNPAANIDDGTCIFSGQICGPGTLWNPETQLCEEDNTCSDLNGDGIVNISDILMVLSTFGFVCE